MKMLLAWHGKRWDVKYDTGGCRVWQCHGGIGCKMWSMIYLWSSAALTTRRKGPGPLARVTIHLSVQPTPRPARPQHRGDKVIGNRESEEILREREREEYCCFIKSAQSYKWWRILLTTDNFLISLKKFYWKYSQNWSWLTCQNNHQISFIIWVQPLWLFNISGIIISHELERKIWKKLLIWHITEDPEPVVDGDDYEVAVGRHHGAVVQVAAAPVEAVAMDEEDNWTRRVLEITWNAFQCVSKGAERWWWQTRKLAMI